MRGGNRGKAGSYGAINKDGISRVIAKKIGNRSWVSILRNGCYNKDLYSYCPSSINGYSCVYFIDPDRNEFVVQNQNGRVGGPVLKLISIGTSTLSSTISQTATGSSMYSDVSNTPPITLAASSSQCFHAESIIESTLQFQNRVLLPIVYTLTLLCLLIIFVAARRLTYIYLPICLYLCYICLLDNLFVNIICLNQFFRNVYNYTLFNYVQMLSNSWCQFISMLPNILRHLDAFLHTALAIDIWRLQRQVLAGQIFQLAKSRTEWTKNVFILGIVIVVIINIQFFWTFELNLIETPRILHGTRINYIFDCSFSKIKPLNSFFITYAWPAIDHLMGEFGLSGVCLFFIVLSNRQLIQLRVLHNTKKKSENEKSTMPCDGILNLKNKKIDQNQQNRHVNSQWQMLQAGLNTLNMLQGLIYYLTLYLSVHLLRSSYIVFKLYYFSNKKKPLISTTSMQLTSTMITTSIITASSLSPLNLSLKNGTSLLTQNSTFRKLHINSDSIHNQALTGVVPWSESILMIVEYLHLLAPVLHILARFIVLFTRMPLFSTIVFQIFYDLFDYIKFTLKYIIQFCMSTKNSVICPSDKQPIATSKMLTFPSNHKRHPNNLHRNRKHHSRSNSKKQNLSSKFNHKNTNFQLNLTSINRFSSGTKIQQESLNPTVYLSEIKQSNPKLDNHQTGNNTYESNNQELEILIHAEKNFSHSRSLIGRTTILHNGEFTSVMSEIADNHFQLPSSDRNFGEENDVESNNLKRSKEDQIFKNDKNKFDVIEVSC